MSPVYDPKDVIYSEEYEAHKKKCSDSFKDLSAQIEEQSKITAKLMIAMYGDEELDEIGVLKMTRAMYKSVITAKGGEKVFWTATKIASGILAILGALSAIFVFAKKIIILMMSK